MNLTYAIHKAVGIFRWFDVKYQKRKQHFQSISREKWGRKTRSIEVLWNQMKHRVESSMRITSQMLSYSQRNLNQKPFAWYLGIIYTCAKQNLPNSLIIHIATTHYIIMPRWKVIIMRSLYKTFYSVLSWIEIPEERSKRN